jgi:hypothetical protein
VGLKSIQGEAEALIFECVSCKRRGNSAERTISFSDLNLRIEPKNVLMDLPACPECGAISTIFFVSEAAKVQCATSHLRAILLKRKYEMEGGDNNEKLASAKVVLARLQKSYTKFCTKKAQREFLGERTFNKLDRANIQPMRTVEPETE